MLRGCGAAARSPRPTSGRRRRPRPASNVSSSFLEIWQAQPVEYRVRPKEDHVYRPNVLKQRLRNGDNVLGCWTMLGHPQVVEILSLAGFDYLVLDQEHGLGDPTTPRGAAPRDVRHADGRRRARAVERPRLSQARARRRRRGRADSRASTPPTRRAPRWLRACYPPRGRRGTAASSVRASSYGMAPNYVATCADELLIACQIESATAVEQHRRDPRGRGHRPHVHRARSTCRPPSARWATSSIPRLRALIERAETRDPRGGAADGHGAASGLQRGRTCSTRGYQFVNAGSDIAYLRERALADVKAFRARYRPT